MSSCKTSCEYFPLDIARLGNKNNKHFITTKQISLRVERNTHTSCKLYASIYLEVDWEQPRYLTKVKIIRYPKKKHVERLSYYRFSDAQFVGISACLGLQAGRHSGQRQIFTVSISCCQSYLSFKNISTDTAHTIQNQGTPHHASRANPVSRDCLAPPIRHLRLSASD